MFAFGGWGLVFCFPCGLGFGFCFPPMEVCRFPNISGTLGLGGGGVRILRIVVVGGLYWGSSYSGNCLLENFSTLGIQGGC